MILDIQLMQDMSYFDSSFVELEGEEDNNLFALKSVEPNHIAE